MQTRKLRKFQIIEAECADFVSEGLGLSHIKASADDFKPLTGFVWGVLPGERFLAKVLRVRSNHFHASVLNLKEIPDDEEWIGKTDGKLEFKHDRWALFNVSPERNDPPCIRFTECGGCKMMHMPYEKTVDLKTDWFKVQLERANVTYSDDIQSIKSDSPFYYRNHVQIHINKHKERGFYAPGSYRTIPFPEKGCLLFRQDLVDAAFPEELELERCVRVRIDPATGKTLTCSLNTPEDKTSEFKYTVAYPAQTLTTVEIPNPSFFQVNLEFIPIWLEKIKQLFDSFVTENDQPVRVLELFSGVGFITKMLSYDRKIESLGVDILKPTEIEKVKITNNKLAQPSIENFARNYIQCDLNRLEAMDATDIEKIQNFSPQLLIINPPRGGFVPEQFEFLLKDILKDKRLPIIFSSCNGSTLARDIAFLQTKEYQMENTTLLDFFPWTSHYEILTTLHVAGS
ncbi:MAG: hypothetical protein ABUK01_06630 [Leptospirales bacterium]